MSLPYVDCFSLFRDPQKPVGLMGFCLLVVFDPFARIPGVEEYQISAALLEGPSGFSAQFRVELT